MSIWLVALSSGACTDAEPLARTEDESDQEQAVLALEEAGIAAVDELTRAGYEVLYLEVRQALDGDELAVEVARDPRFASTQVDPVSIPVGPLSAQLGRPVVARTSLGQAEEGEGVPVTVTRYLAIAPEIADEEPPGDDGSESPEIEEPYAPLPDLETRLERDLAAHPEVVEEDGTVLVRLVFSPAIPADAPYRVDWLGGLEGVVSRREAIRRAEEEERQPVVQAAIDAGLGWLEELGVGCDPIARRLSTNGVTLRCPIEDARRIASEGAGQVRWLGLGNPDSIPLQNSGTQFRAIEGVQLGIAIAAGYDGEGPTSSSGDNITVGLIDGEGFYGANFHPAYWTAP